MDSDNLLGICIYLVNQLKNKYIICDYFLINDFVSENIQLSSRSIFLGLIKGGVDYILDQIE